MRRGLLGGVLAIVMALLVADVASAQMFRRGRGGYYGNGYGNGYYGNGYYGNGYYGNGYYGNGYYGNGSYGPGGYSSNNGNWGNWNGANTYGWGNTQNLNDGNYRSFYPPNYNDGSQFNQQDERFGGNQRGTNQQGQGQAFIMVRVPSPDAQVWFDDHRTQQGGTQRFFESPPLQSGSKYSYQIRAKWRENGKDMEKTRTVRVQPGQRAMVDFNQSGNQQGERLNQPNRADQNRNNQSNRNQSNQNQSDRNQSNQNPPRQNQDQNPPQQDQ